MLTAAEIAPQLPGVSAPAGLKPLFRGVWQLSPWSVMPDTPAGNRVIVNITDGFIHGRGIAARLDGAAADWLAIGPHGIGTMDWRGQVVTDDGAIIYMHGTGRLDTTKGMVAYGTCLFETSADQLRWLNKLQAVFRSETIRQGEAGAIYHDEYFELV